MKKCKNKKKIILTILIFLIPLTFALTWQDKFIDDLWCSLTGCEIEGSLNVTNTITTNNITTNITKTGQLNVTGSSDMHNITYCDDANSNCIKQSVNATGIKWEWK
jgi:hypothetical protein